jgi:hypothetical protein
MKIGCGISTILLSILLVAARLVAPEQAIALLGDLIVQLASRVGVELT